MRIAVIGTGVLGPEIAQVFAQCGSVEKVLLCKGRSTSRDGKRAVAEAYEKLVLRGKFQKEEAEAFLGKIEAGELSLAAGADLLVEAVAEDLAIKKSVLGVLDSICAPDCIFTTNTSSLPIAQIASSLSRPLIGMHFFNPAPVMKLVEVIVNENTPQDQTNRVVQLAKDAGKNPVVVNEAPGFIVNRVLIPMINEAVGIYAEGVASVEAIDTAMKLGANMPMGPLALGDLIGLDVVLSILNVMLKETGDVRYLPQAMLKKMVREGKLGRKTGEGFYRYPDA